MKDGSRKASSSLQSQETRRTYYPGQRVPKLKIRYSSLIKDEDLNSTKMMQKYIDVRTKREVDPIGKYKKIVSDKIVKKGAQQSYDFGLL